MSEAWSLTVYITFYYAHCLFIMHSQTDSNTPNNKKMIKVKVSIQLFNIIATV